MTLDPFPDSFQFRFQIDLRMIDPNGDLRGVVLDGAQIVPRAAIDDKPWGLDGVADMLADAAADAMREAVKRIREQPVVAETARVVVPTED
jgi:DNA-binding protein YbaB